MGLNNYLFLDFQLYLDFTCVVAVTVSIKQKCKEGPVVMFGSCLLGSRILKALLLMSTILEQSVFEDTFVSGELDDVISRFSTVFVHS